MKILLISDNKIHGFGGGCLEEKKYYDGLKLYARRNGMEFKILSPDGKSVPEAFDIDLKKNKFIDMYVRLKGHSSYIYYNFKKNKKKFRNYNPDMVVIGRSRFGYIAKFYKKLNPNCKIVCNMENVEYDYVNGYFADSRGLLRNLYVKWEKKCVKRDEKMALKYCDAINFLSIRDQKRTHNLYKVNNKREMILPICLENSKQLYLQSDIRNVVFIGSLNYKSNIAAITRFIENVWMKYFNSNNNLNLIIAGSNPGNELEQKIRNINNCILYKNFKKIEDIVPKKSLMIAPIQNGAGMKVKVAETLSMGLPIVASDEALVGYDLALEKCNKYSIIRANIDMDYVNAIKIFLNLSDEELSNIEQKNKDLYKNYYNYNVSRTKISEMCRSIINV